MGLDIIAIYEQAETIMGVQAPMPVVEIGAHNTYTLDRVTVVFNECFDVNLAHEFSHHLAIAGHKLDGVKNEYVKGVLAEIALDVETKFELWSPNCVTRR